MQVLYDYSRFVDKAYLDKLLTDLESSYKKRPFMPYPRDVFKAFKLTPYNDLKVIMLGQDPYPQRNVATGILFGNHKETPEDKLSPSLKVVKESILNLEVPRNNFIFDNSLENWSKQGILMLNSALTVNIDNIGSHSLLWYPFMKQFIKNITEVNTGLIFVLFGKQAQGFKQFIGVNNYVLEEKHPAYYAREGIRMPRRVFNEVEELLKKNYNFKINWYGTEEN